MEQEIKNKSIDEIREDDHGKWVHDASLDHKGQVPLRASTGVWKASFFIIAIEFSERLSYFGIATNLISYLTRVMHQDLKAAAKNVNNWSGVTTMMPLVGGFLADSYTGRFSMILIASILYLMGLGLLTMTQFIPSLKPCGTDLCTQTRKVHKVVFFLAIYLLSLGTGGHKPCLESFGADQFDDDHMEERKQKMSYFNWWNFALCCGLLLGVTLIAYAEDYASWGVASLILTVTMAITIMIFYFGKGFYRYRVPEGSPLTPMSQVLVAALRKRNMSHPSSPALLYEVPKSEKSKGRLLCHTNSLRFLDKAAIIEGSENILSRKQPNPWILATVTQVEEMKLVINLIPIWLTSLTFGLCMAQASTFFVKQSSIMNRKIGQNFEFPPASIGTISASGMIITVILYDKILVPLLRGATGNERGIEILRRIGIGMAFAVCGMTIAALVERKRLGVVERDIMRGQRTETLSVSAFWLAPQLIVLGIADGFTLVGLQEFFYEQVPDSMRSLGIAFYLSVIGLGNLLSSYLITTVDHITTSAGNSWFGKDLNESHLDNFYWLLAVLNGLNLFIYVVIARRFKYKNVQRSVSKAGCSVGDGIGSMA
ncbi:hypothetical protein RHGRI_007928 [Rhododendron griersonianum]|uniref:NPF family transporter n=1 Tax=Rhododendron griersonianum TaxID=479676 RepID=A0AAV6L005_9ERIC|nr:hypothetical protein RHGRI_007928 [Rhododendron griersonianum]